MVLEVCTLPGRYPLNMGVVLGEFQSQSGRSEEEKFYFPFLKSNHVSLVGQSAACTDCDILAPNY
jgi:hypothetical protein